MKKFISTLLLICMLMLGAAPVFAQSNESNPFTANPLCGDSDFDNTVTIKDASLIQKHVASLITMTEEQMQSSDVDGNGRVNIVDATWIQKKVAFICDKFPAETEPTEATNPDSTTEVTTETSLATDPTEAETSTAPATEITTTEATDPTEVTTTVESTTEDEIEVTTTTVETTAQDPTEEPTETTTETSTEVPTEIPTETTTEEPTEVPTEIPTEPEPTEPTTEMPTETPTEPEPTEPIIPNIETYGPIDPIEEDILTAEMLWKIEEEFFRLVNEERVRVGAKPLTYNKHLDDMAQIRSAEIIVLHSHTRPNGEDFWEMVDVNEYNYKYLGENICVLYYIPNDIKCFIGSDEQVVNAAKEVFTAFKNSPGHYQNMVLEDYENTGIGISYVWDADLNVPVLFMSQIFGVEKN